MHETGVAERSPRDEKRESAYLIVDDFAESHYSYRIRARISVDIQPHDKFFIEHQVFDFVRINKLRAVNGVYQVSRYRFALVETKIY